MATPPKKPTPRRPSRGPNFVHSLAKGLEVLSHFSRGDLLGNQELVERTGLPKATVSRLTSTLLELGYLRLDEASRKFFMGTRVLGMGASVQRNIGLHRAARPFMERLSQEMDVTVALGARDRLGIVFLELIRPKRSRLTVNSDIGSVLPIESTAIGLSYLVAAPLAERTRLLDALRKRYPDNWPAIRGNIEKAHQEFERHGFVSSQKSWGREVNGIAVPLMLQKKGGLFTLSCAGPSHQLSQAFMRSQLGPRLLALVADIRNTLDKNPQGQLVAEDHIP